MSWNKSQFPRKHFIAVFAACQEWGFSALPEEYGNSVFITLETENLGFDEPVRNTEYGPQSNSLCSSRGDNREI